MTYCLIINDTNNFHTCHLHKPVYAHAGIDRNANVYIRDDWWNVKMYARRYFRGFCTRYATSNHEVTNICVMIFVCQDEDCLPAQQQRALVARETKEIELERRIRIERLHFSILPFSPIFRHRLRQNAPLSLCATTRGGKREDEAGKKQAGVRFYLQPHSIKRRKWRAIAFSSPWPT